MNDDHSLPRPVPPVPEDETSGELRYLRRHSQELAAKILALDVKSVGIRHELEQKRRGFSLMAELAVALGQDGDYQSVFISVSKRINAALNMQRTAVLVPEAGGAFRASVLQGYPPEEETRIAAERFTLDAELLEPRHAVLVTGAEPADRLAGLRQSLALPYFISSPVLLHKEVAAVLITGRLLEQPPFFPRLGLSDVETVQTVSAHLAAMLAGRRLLEAEERTQIMLDAMPLCCTFWDTSFRNIDCNEEAVRLFDLSSKQEFLNRFFDLSPQFQPNGRLSLELALERIQAAFSTGRIRFEWTHQKLNGEPIPMEITLVRVKRGSGYIVVGYMRDLRELKAMLGEMRETEKELRLARDLAEKSARAKSEFLANMSHEIRTPMNAVLGMTHLLSSTEMTEKQRLYVEKADHSARLLLYIINDILDFSKIDAGRMEMESIPFSVRKLIRNVNGVITEQAEAKALVLRIAVGTDVPDFLVGDPLRLEQILLNLAGNAVKFTPSGEVSLRVSLDAPPQTSSPGQVRLLFEIRDTGIGMSAEQVASLFTPFSQADASITRKYGGTGLGLAICRSLVEMMGGTIWCASRPNEGSLFSFTATFPLADREISGGRARPAPAEDDVFVPEALPAETRADADIEDDFADLRGMRVLLAEDNDINQMIARELLAAKGIVVDVAGTGLEALAALERGKYDLVLMDIQMPEMDGLTATARIRANPAHADMPVVAMTAHAMVGDREISLGGGMDDHLTKPIEPHKLYTALRKWGRRSG